MPRAGPTKPAVAPRLPDRVAIGVLTQTFPPELVDRVIATTGRGEQRWRLLPARVVVYYALAMCLFAQVGYEEVMRLLVEGLAWARRWQGSWQVPHKSSIPRARARLGPAPLPALFAEVARPLATRRTKGAWYRGWRLVGLDGTTLDVPDTPANVAAFGRPGGGRGPGAFPQMRLVGLVECGTHAVVDAAMGGCTWTRGRWHRRWLARLARGCCCLSTRACAAWSCGAPSRRPGRSWCGAAARTSS